MSELPNGIVTFLMTDVVDSAHLTERYPLKMPEIIRRHIALIQSAVEQRGGTLIKSRGEGDSTFSVFKHALSALEAAIDAQRALLYEPFPIDSPFRVRMAIYTGEAEQREGDYLGVGTVNRCARLRGLAHGGQILISRSTWSLAQHHLPEGARLLDLGVYTLRGIETSEQIYQLVHPDLLQDFPPLVESPQAPVNRNPDFIGRKKILGELQRLIGAGQSIALTGMSGIGKTQVAVELAFSLSAQSAGASPFPGGIFWVNASDDAQFQNDLGTVGARLGLSRDYPPAELATQAKQLIERMQSPCLLFIDDWAEPAGLDLIPQSRHCRVLLTTRAGWIAQQTLRARGFQLVALPPLSQKETLSLLQVHRRAKGAQELEAVREIAERVGFLPLALTLISNHVGWLGISFNDYLQRFKQPADMMEHLEQAREQFADFTGHSGEVFTAIADSYELLSEPARDALAALCFCGGYSVSRELLHATQSGLSVSERDELWAILRDRSLVRFELDGALTVHELVKAYVLSQVDEEAPQEVFRTMARILANELSQMNLHASWDPRRLVASQCSAAIQTCEQFGWVESQMPLLMATGFFAYHHGDYELADHRFEAGLQLSERLYGRDHLTTAQFMRALGRARQERRQHASALPLVMDALRIAEAEENAPADSAEYYISAGYVLKREGDFTSKRELYDRALPYYLRALTLSEQANDLQETSRCLNNLGTLFEETGDWERALEFLNRALLIDQQLNARERQAIRHNNIGRVLGRAGAWEDAVHHHRLALELYLQIYGSESIHVAMSQQWMARACLETGDHTQARALFRDALPTLQRLYAPTHRIWQECEPLMALIPNGV